MPFTITIFLILSYTGGISFAQIQGNNSRTNTSPENNFLTSINPVTLIISAAALTSSLFALWHNYLAPFNLKLTYTEPVFKLYEIQPLDTEGKGWWIPSFSMMFSFYNAGKRLGEVLDVRLFCVYFPKDSNESVKTYAFYPIWIVKTDVLENVRTRDDLSNAIITTWHPTMIPGKETKEVHLVLEAGPWDKPKAGKVNIQLQIRTSKNPTWKKLEFYEFSFYNDMVKESAARFYLGSSSSRDVFDNHESYSKI